MTKFNVGDRVIMTDRGGSNYMWKGVTGAITSIRDDKAVLTVDKDAKYSNGESLTRYYYEENGAGSWDDDSFELIEQFVDPRDVELTELRQFKADAIAKYPDLAPMSEEDKFILEQYNAYWSTDYSNLDTVRKSDTYGLLIAGIKWGRKHA